MAMKGGPPEVRVTWGAAFKIAFAWLLMFLAAQVMEACVAEIMRGPYG